MQLEFQIINNAGRTPTPNVIFITDDPAYNKVSLQIHLTSGSTTLLPGTIPDPMSPPTVGTTLYVDLSSLQLSSKVWDQLTFTAAGAGWAFKKFAHSVLGMTPTQPIVLKSGNSNNISIGIGGIVVSLPLAPPVLFYVMYYNVPNVVGQTSSFQVAIQNPPVGTNKLSDDIQVALYPSDGTIVNSVLPKLEAPNRFSLQFSSRQEVQVEAGEDTAFTVSFVYGKLGDKNGFGALTDVTHATQINTDGSNAERWTITLNGSAQNPYWTLQPPAGVPIVGTGERAVVAIESSNIVTTYQPGPTAMLIQYSGVPGYQDGTFELVLNKVAHAVIHTFDVVPEYSCLSDDGTANVTVRWSASDAVSLELTQAGQGPIPVTGMSQVPAVIEAAKTVFTLKATGAAGTVENADSKHVTAFALPPIIREFSGSITTKHNGRLSLQLTWSTKGAAAVSISGNRSPVDRSGSLTITPTRQKPLRANYILTAMNVAGKTTATVTIGNWKPTSLKSVPDLQRIAITPDGTRIFTSSGFPSNGCLSVFDAFTLALAAQPIQIPYIYGLDVSPDGKLVAACEIGFFSEANVYLFDAETLAPARGSPKKVPVPTTLKFSPDSNQLYVVNNAGTFGPGTLTVLFAVQLKPIQGSPFNLASMFNPGDTRFLPWR